MPSIRLQFTVFSVAAACAAMSCAKTDDERCIDQLRPLGAQRQHRDRHDAAGDCFAIPHRRCHLVMRPVVGIARQPADGDVVTARRDDDGCRRPALERRRRDGGDGDGGPSGGRVFCPPTVTMDLDLRYRAEDGGFADSWNVSGHYLDGHRQCRRSTFDPRAVGVFHGSHTFTPPDQFSFDVRGGVVCGASPRISAARWPRARSSRPARRPARYSRSTDGVVAVRANPMPVP